MDIQYDRVTSLNINDLKITYINQYLTDERLILFGFCLDVYYDSAAFHHDISVKVAVTEQEFASFTKEQIQIVIESRLRMVLSKNWHSGYVDSFGALAHSYIPGIFAITGPVLVSDEAAASKSLASLAQQLPGAMIDVEHPCEHKGEWANDSIYAVIIHLNDSHKWTRDQIADWLETLDEDLEFKNGNSSN